jgi:hypothetical protein
MGEELVSFLRDAAAGLDPNDLLNAHAGHNSDCNDHNNNNDNDNNNYNYNKTATMRRATILRSPAWPPPP